MDGYSEVASSLEKSYKFEKFLNDWFVQVRLKVFADIDEA
jgi:hypothetical protein